MSKKYSTKPLITILGALLVLSSFSVSIVHADQNPFLADKISSDLILASHHGGGKDKMKMMDTDGDGSVSKDEFMNHKEQKFIKKDANGDGVLTEDEMQKNCKHKGMKKSAEE